jgi:class 3 adenylate cyclase
MSFPQLPLWTLVTFIKNPALLAIFSGNFSSTSAGNEGLAPAFEIAQSESDQAIILVDREEIITWVNKRASKQFYLTDPSNARLPLTSYLRFDCPPSEKAIETRVTALQAPGQAAVTFPMRVSKFFIEKKEQYVLFLVDLTDTNVKKRQIMELEEEIQSLRRSVIPPGLTDATIEVRDCVVLVVQLHDFTAFLSEFSAEDAADRLTRFVTIVTETAVSHAERGWRVVMLRQLGDALWVVFNLVPAEARAQQLSETAAQTLAFCREIGALLHARGLEFRMGVATDAVARAGMISPDRLLFDLYGPAMGTAATLARQAAVGTALITQAIARFDDSGELQVAHIHAADGHDEAFYEMTIK